MINGSAIKEAQSQGFMFNGQWQGWHLNLSESRRHRGETKGGDVAELTGVGHELERAAEFPVAGSRASAHVEDVGGQRGQTFDVGVSRRRLDDSVASFILVLKDGKRGKT